MYQGRVPPPIFPANKPLAKGQWYARMATAAGLTPHELKNPMFDQVQLNILNSTRAFAVFRNYNRNNAQQWKALASSLAFKLPKESLEIIWKEAMKLGYKMFNHVQFEAANKRLDATVEYHKFDPSTRSFVSYGIMAEEALDRVPVTKEDWAMRRAKWDYEKRKAAGLVDESVPVYTAQEPMDDIDRFIAEFDFGDIGQPEQYAPGFNLPPESFVTPGKVDNQAQYIVDRDDPDTEDQPPVKRLKMNTPLEITPDMKLPLDPVHPVLREDDDDYYNSRFIEVPGDFGRTRLLKVVRGFDNMDDVLGYGDNPVDTTNLEEFRRIHVPGGFMWIRKGQAGEPDRIVPKYKDINEDFPLDSDVYYENLASLYYDYNWRLEDK